MSAVIAIIIGGCGLMMVYSVVGLFRNQWVFRQRQTMLSYCYDRDTREWAALGQPRPDDFLPSYDVMMAKFWVWDVNKFLKRPLDLDERAKLLATRGEA